MNGDGDELQELVVVEHNPLWMPRGSVRALIAIALILATIYAAVVLRDVADTGILATLSARVIGDYFQARKDGM